MQTNDTTLGSSNTATVCKRVALTSLLFAGLTAASGISLHAADSRNIRFRHISTETGLSQNTVEAIVQDRDGLMWFGTQEGLNRYDGYEFTAFKPDSENASSLSHTFVWTVFEDREGILWVGTDGGGLNRFDRVSETFTHYVNEPTNPSSLSNNTIRAIYEDRKGTLWIGTDGGGLNELDRATNRFKRYNHNPSNEASLSNDHVRSIVEDSLGALWVGTDGGGLSRLDVMTGRFTHFQNDPERPESLGDDRVRVVLEDSRGAIWVGTYDWGLDRLDRTTGVFTHFRAETESGSGNSLANNQIRALHEDSQGTLWVGTDAGLSEWRPETNDFVTYIHDPTGPTSLSDNRVLSIAEDRGGVLWVGTFDGLNTWNLRTGFFTHYKDDGNSTEQLRGNVIQSFAESPDGQIWIASYGKGLNKLDPKTGRFTHLKHDPDDPKSLVDDRVMSLLVDSEGFLWTGTYHQGLDRLDPVTSTFSHFRHNPEDSKSLSANAVTRIFEDSNDILWIGTYKGGLNRFDRANQHFIRYKHDSENPTALSNDRVLAITEGEGGVLWIGTDGGGLNRFDPQNGTFAHYRHDPDNPDSLSSDDVWAILKDGRGRLWVGTQGGGLNRWDAAPRRNHRGVFKHFTTQHGLPSEVINGILEDDSGHLWISTNRGISKFDPDTEVFKNYEATHGLQANEFNFGSVFKSSEGEMFFGGPNGFNAFFPENVNDNPHAPPVLLTSFLKFNQPVDLEQPIADVRQIELTHKDYVVAFEFSALDYTAPEKNRYMYKLEGFDEDWIEAGDMRRATYTNLGPREYTFRVKAANNDGVWNEEGLSIGVNVIPPPWRTWWAYTLYGFSGLGFVFAYNRKQAMKLEREAEYNRTLSHEVKLRTQELAQRNEELEAFNAKLEEASLTDSLTGFWNRRFLLKQIPKELADVERYYAQTDEERAANKTGTSSLLFLMFDLDGFKGLNDTYGHAAGDRVLIQVRKMLLDVCRQSDMLIRWGGDEFLLLGRNSDPETAEALAERIRNVMEDKAFDVGLEQTVHLSCSIGFSFYPFDSRRPSFFSWEQVVAIADRALYVAKESGRNAWAGILSTARSRTPDLFKRINDDLEVLVKEGAVDLRDSGNRRPRLVRESTIGKHRPVQSRGAV